MVLEGEKRPLERLQATVSRALGLRNEELGRTGLMFLYLFFALLSHYILKPVSSALFIDRLGADQLPYIYLAMAGSGGLLAYIYARLATRWSLRTAIDASTALILISLLCISQLLLLNQPWVIYAIKIWVGMFSLVLVSQGWLVASNIFDTRSAKRTYTLLSAGAVLGSVAGGGLTSKIANAVGTNRLLPMSAVFVLLGYGCYRLLLKQPGVTIDSAHAAEDVSEFRISDVAGSVTRNPHMQVIVGILAITYIVDTLVDYQFSTMAGAAHKGDNLTAFLGGFYGVYLGLATLAAMLFTPFVVNRFGVGGTLLVMPVGIGLGSLGMLVSPGVLASGVTRLVEASTRYSFNRTGMELLYLPLPVDLRNRAKAFMDMFVDRMARGVGALLILGAGLVAGSEITHITVLVLIFCVLWVCLAVYGRNEYVETVRTRLASRRLDLESVRIPYQDAGLLRMLEQSALRGEGRQALYAISLLEQVPDYPLEQLAVRICAGSTPQVRGSLYQIALRRRWTSLLRDAKRELELPPGPSSRPAIAYYCTVSPDGPAALVRLLSRDDSRILESAIEAAMDVDEPLRRSSRMPIGWVRDAASSESAARRRLGALAYRLYPEAAPAEAPALLCDRDSAVRRAAATTLRTQGPAAIAPLASILADPSSPEMQRLRAARVLGSIRHQSSVDALMGRLGETNLMLRASILRSLERLRERAPELKYAEGPVRQQIYREAREFHQMRMALGVLAASDGRQALPLLVRTLDDRLRRSVTRLFQLLGLRYPPSDIRAAYKAFEKGDASALSNAIEFLDNILDHDMKRFVLPMVDQTEPQGLLGRDMFEDGPERPEDALRTMITSKDLWLATCAMAAAAELRFRGLEAEIRIAGRQGGTMVEQVAASALRQLAGAAN